MQLRPYQQAAADAVIESFRTNDSALVVMPTGTGKTVLFSRVIEDHDWGRCLVLAHREELIRQAANKIEQVSGYAPDVEMAGEYADKSMFHRNPVIVSSIQTQSNGRMERFNPDQFGLVIIDEAHHATAKSYRRVVDHYRQNPGCKILGVTATPDRADESALGQVFDDVAFVYELSEAIGDGWLVPVYQKPIVVSGLDLSSVRTTAGDLNQGDLEAILNEEFAEQEMAGPIYEVVGQRKALIFTVSVKQAERLADVLNRYEPECARWVCGKTPRHERSQTLRDYSAGRFRFLVNVGVFTEGFDEPTIDVVVMGRPTKSRALYSQMVGRGTRPLAGLVDDAGSCPERRRRIATSAKPHLEVIDFVGNAGRHKLVTTADILGGKYDDDVVQLATERIQQADSPKDVSEALEDAFAEIERRKADERRRRLQVVAKANYKIGGPVDPFDLLDITQVPARGWDRVKKPSAKMIEVLERNGVYTDGVTFSQASQLIAAMIERRQNNKCTFKQAKWLVSHGYSPDMTMADASSTMDAWKQNGWKRPEPVVEAW